MTTETLRPHTSHRYDEELEDIRNRVMAMGGLVEQQLSDALVSLCDRQEELAEDVVSNDAKVNQMEVEIDEFCTQVLARRQPAASDLRFLMAMIKTITDLERIGDESKDVGRMALQTADRFNFALHVGQIESMGERVKKMLHMSLDSLARFDVDLALNVALEDLKVDRDYDAIMRQMLTVMMEDPRNIPDVMHLCWSARALERVGDRCRNIGEYVIYLVKGKDVRHTNVDRIVEEVKA